MRHQEIPPENQLEHTGESYPPNQAMLDFISFAYSDKSFDGIIQFSKSDPVKKGFKLLGCAKFSQLAAHLQHIRMFPAYNYYISSNIFARPGNSKENLLAINAIVIDIDNHSTEHTIAEIGLRVEKLLWRLQNDFFGQTDIPIANRIVLTGRGLQLWWCVVPAFAKAFERNFADVEKHFEQQLEQFLSDFPIELEGFEIDKGASAKPAGFFRLPGSISPHTGKETEVICLHDTRIDLLTYRDQHLPASERAVRMKRIWNSRPSSSYTPSETERLMHYRLSVIERLRDIRSAPVGSETRNNFCLLYYCFAKQVFGDEEAYRRTQEFNDGFAVPLLEKELRCKLCTARRKDYKFRTETIIALLGISDDEMKAIGLCHPASKSTSKSKKEARNQQIIELFNQGFLQKEVAQMLNISRPTVSKVIQENTPKISTLAAQIQSLLQTGKSTAEISKELNCSKRTVERSKINPSKRNTAARKECDKKSKKGDIYGFPPEESKTAQGHGTGAAMEAASTGHLPQQATVATGEHVAYSGEINLYEPFINGELTFLENDTLAKVDNTNPARVEAAVLATLIVAEQQDGNLYIAQQDLKSHVNGFLQCYSAPGRGRLPLTDLQITTACDALCRKELVVADQSATEGVCCYLKYNYEYETGAAECLSRLLASHPKCSLSPEGIFSAIQDYEVQTGISLSLEQKNAILLALTNPVAIITGGPGTGKTATMAALCHVLKNVAPKARVELSAPTGKAAVRLSTVTGMPAKTIHSLKGRKINCAVLIVDEASMVDIELLYGMLKMLNKGAHLLFIGDSDQLPCIGGGNAFRDMIVCKKIPTVNLSQVYRQTGQNDIVTYANTIKTAPEDIPFPRSTSIDDDICFIKLQEAPDIEQKVAEIAESLKSVGYTAADVQVLAPTREWSNSLNLRLKSVFNPTPNGQKAEPYTIGDRVIYTKNDYVQKLHNGQTGIVSSVTEKTVTVNYDGQTIRHRKADFEYLELAYSLTIHKAQGSEYPIVIIPVHESMGRALTRNLVYTAITRAKTQCILVGSEFALRNALSKTLADAHKSLLSERLISILE